MAIKSDIYPADAAMPPHKTHRLSPIHSVRAIAKHTQVKQAKLNNFEINKLHKTAWLLMQINNTFNQRP